MLFEPHLRLAAHLLLNDPQRLPELLKADLDWLREQSSGMLDGELVAVPSDVQAELHKQLRRGVFSHISMHEPAYRFSEYDLEYLREPCAYTNQATIDRLRLALKSLAGVKITSIAAAKAAAREDGDGYFAFRPLAVIPREEKVAWSDEPKLVGHTLHAVFGTNVCGAFYEDEIGPEAELIWQREVARKGHVEDIVDALVGRFPDAWDMDGAGVTITFASESHLLAYLNAVEKTTAGACQLWAEADLVALRTPTRAAEEVLT